MKRFSALPIALAMLAMLVGGPGCALAQGRGHRMGAGGDQGQQRSALHALEPQMQQLGGLMHQMAERIKAGPLTPDQALHLSGMMEQMATIMGFARDTCNLVPQSHSSKKVRLLGQPIGMLLDL